MEMHKFHQALHMKNEEFRHFW